MDSTLIEQFKDIGKEGYKTLSSKTVAIAGLGGVGSIVAEILARSGVQLRIVEKGRVTASDMPRLGLYLQEDESKFKAKQAKKRLELINPESKIKAFHEEITEDNVFLLESDMIVEATNNTNTRLLINKYALEHKIPLVTHEFSGDKAHVLVVDKQQHKKGPCAHCLKQKLDFPDIRELGAYPPTTHFIAALMASAVIKNLIGMENVHTLLKIDMMKTEVRHINVEKEKNCTHCKGK